MLKRLQNKYVRFGFSATLYILFLIWLRNLWLLPGLIIIYDLYVSKKVNWTFWKKREGKNNAVVEWIDALIFAVVAVTLINIFLFQNYKIPTPSMEGTMLVGDHLYVSKLAYGPRVPHTPIAFPFTQNRMPLINKESYVTWIQWKYKRLAGLTHVKRNDIVVFNFPAGDTVVLENSAASYYSIVRQFAFQQKMSDEVNSRQTKTDEEYYQMARDYVRSNFTIVNRPVDRRDNYIKRCVAIPGDTIQVIDGIVYINGIREPSYEGLQYNYNVKTNGTPLNPRVLANYGISREYLNINANPNYVIPLSESQISDLKSNIPEIISIERYIERVSDFQIYPNIQSDQWNVDNYGPLWIPSKGTIIELTERNVATYRMAIENYEGNRLELKDGKVFLNGEEEQQYTFQMDYYFMMGDNRHRSADSRFWGFVPEDHIVGKPKFIWLSTNKERKFPHSIRWNRMFKVIDSSE
jgi:signal peptidase I